jgi:RNA polymerase sigma-70 factor (ECF subfamily)
VLSPRIPQTAPGPASSNRLKERRRDGQPGSSADDLLNFARDKEVCLGQPDTPTPPGGTENELLEGCRDGDLAAYEKLYERHASRMKSIAFNLLGNAADAEDAVQDAFLKIYRGVKTFRGGAAFSTWIYRIVVNTSYDALRRRKTRPAGPSVEAIDGREILPPSPGSDHPLRLALAKSVARLKPKHRAVFLLFEVEGFTHGEIARILGIPEGTSKTFLFDAKKNLQRWLAARPAAAPRTATP